TGFRAGHMTEGFSGCLIIDDPNKPEDAFSKVKLEATNRKLLTTVKSRLAHPDIPIILIMQRIATNDCVGFIEKGNLNREFKFLSIPALIDENYYKKLDEKYQKKIEFNSERVSYWPYKERLED